MNLFMFCCKNQGTNLHEILCFSEEMVSKFSHERVSFLCAFGCWNWSQGHTGLFISVFFLSKSIFLTILLSISLDFLRHLLQHLLKHLMNLDSIHTVWV